ncbi:hypothetical protein FYK55_06020 [Roseiconus nitratireducens]|uniref:Uncharacterized protein n=1 Tax=Roseiconus nitratireducens TaxID=2605748 RepID=A0A5M6DFV0_9BACT|nr:hypothetical protein [Roseiconus nitratireducens]KAA5545220.1 hypothetical protein FYK55_06020 [Roseiconus nitratireducens]
MPEANSPAPLLLTHPREGDTVSFVWHGDRFVHTVRLGSFSVASESADSDPTWPTSPPIQQLSIETLGGHPVALGVGGAGQSHWSLSVEPTTDGFLFDCACRVKQQPGWLGSSYPTQPGLSILAHDGSVIRQDEAGVRIEPSPVLSDAGTYRWKYEIRPS